MASVFVRLAGSDHAFSEVELLASKSVAWLAERAAAKCGWGVAPSRVRLFLVERASTARDPTVEEESAALDKPFLQSTSLLASAGVVHDSCLLARVTAAPGIGACSTLGAGLSVGCAPHRCAPSAHPPPTQTRQVAAS